MEEFRGENNADSLVNQRLYGRSKPFLDRLRNYTLIGHGRARKRYGYQRLTTTQINGANAVNALYVHDFSGVRTLIGISGGTLKTYNEGDGTWTDRTGGLTLNSGDDDQYRLTPFTDGVTDYLLGTDGTNLPFAAIAGGNAVTIESIDPQAPPICTDISEWHGYIFTLYRERVEHSAYGRLDWSENNIIDSTTRSLGVALQPHAEEAMLVFYEGQVNRIMFNERQGPTFLSFPIQGSEGCISKASVCTKDDATYYATARGIRRISLGRFGWEDKFIGREIEKFWQECNRARFKFIVGIPRGEPFNDILFLVSYGTNSAHNAILCWNTQLNAWSIWPASTTSGKLNFSCGTNFIDTNDIPRTVMGGYSGNTWDAFGHINADTSFTDDGANIATSFRTGLIDLGYAGMKNMRQIILEVEATVAKTFSYNIEPLGVTPVTGNFPIVQGGDLLDVGFTLDESVLSVATVDDTEEDIDADGRYFSIEITENDNDEPHTLAALTIPYVRKGMRTR
jgi:hypothetical protein